MASFFDTQRRRRLKICNYLSMVDSTRGREKPPIESLLLLDEQGRESRLCLPCGGTYFAPIHPAFNTQSETETRVSARAQSRKHGRQRIENR